MANGDESDKFTMALHQRHFDFWTCLNRIVGYFNSDHPWDKAINTTLVKGGMTKEEVKQYRELTLKAAKAYYGKSNL